MSDDISRKWSLYQHDQAIKELDTLFANDDVKSEIRRLLKLLAQEADPRHPKNKSLDVTETEHDAPGWYRLVIRRYGIRVIFRLKQQRGDFIVEISPTDAIESDLLIIEVTQALPRNKSYGKTLRERYKVIKQIS